MPPLTHMQALKLLAEASGDLVETLVDGSDEEIVDVVKGLLSRSSRIAQLEGAGEVLLKAWLEQRPESQIARDQLTDYLVTIGKADEALRVEGGEPMGPLSNAELELNRLDENLRRSAEPLGFAPPPSAKKR